jgi:hypothetical protein
MTRWAFTLRGRRIKTTAHPVTAKIATDLTRKVVGSLANVSSDLSSIPYTPSPTKEEGAGKLQTIRFSYARTG